MWIENHNPFDDNEPLLRSIATGLTATKGDGINCDEAEKIGQAIQDQLNGISITEATIKKKDQIKTLELLKMGVEIDKEKIYVDPMLLFSRLLVLIEREEEIREYFRFELTGFPISLFKNGMMRKANKSKLAKALKKNISSNSYQADQSFHVLDGDALLHKVKWLPNTSCQSILNQYSRYVKSKYS